MNILTKLLRMANVQISPARAIRISFPLVPFSLPSPKPRRPTAIHPPKPLARVSNHHGDHAGGAGGGGRGDPRHARGLHLAGELGQVLRAPRHRRQLRVVRGVGRPPRPAPLPPPWPRRRRGGRRQGPGDPGARVRELGALGEALRRRVPPRHQRRLLPRPRRRHAPPPRSRAAGDALARHGHDRHAGTVTTPPCASSASVYGWLAALELGFS